MTLHYLDPSAWVKRHFHEQGSQAITDLFHTGSFQPACCRLGLVEMIATVARKSHRDTIDDSTTKTLLDNIRADFSAFQIVAADEERIVSAAALALRHHLRTMDALHLACALWLRAAGELVLVSADAELLAAANHEGLSTFNPALSAE